MNLASLRRRALAALVFAIVGAANGTAARVDISSRPWYHYIGEEMPPAKIPQVTNFTLANGISVYYIKASAVPTVSLNIYVAGGGFEVPVEKLGLQSLWGETLVFSGSKKMDRNALSNYLENRASQFSFSAGLERSAFTIGSLAHYFARDVKELFAVLQEPQFAGEDFDLLVQRVLKEFERRDENPAKWASLGVVKTFWDGTVRGRYATTQTVKNIVRDDLAEWQKKLWRADRLTLAIAGDIDEAKLKALLEETFGKMPRDNKAAPDMRATQVMPTGKANALYLLPKEIPQTTVIYKAPGMKHGDKDYYALRIFDFLLGGDSFNSYLTQKIRTEKGWAYTAYSTFETDDFTGSLMLFTQTANVNLPDVIGAIDGILAHPEAFVSREKIEQAKLSLKNKFVFLFENPAQYLKLYLQLKWDGLPDTYLATYVKNLSSVSEADVLRVGRAFYKPQNFSVLLCGPNNIYQKKSAVRPETAAVLTLEK